MLPPRMLVAYLLWLLNGAEHAAVAQRGAGRCDTRGSAEWRRRRRALMARNALPLARKDAPASLVRVTATFNVSLPGELLPSARGGCHRDNPWQSVAARCGTGHGHAHAAQRAR